MKKGTKFIKNDAIYIGILAFMLLCFLTPYYGWGLPQAYENDFHYSRIISLVETLRLGILPPKIRPMLMQGFGYAVGIFYPDTHVYIPAGLIFLGVEPMLALKMLVAIVAVIGTVVTYKSFEGVTKSSSVALVATKLYA